MVFDDVWGDACGGYFCCGVVSTRFCFSVWGCRTDVSDECSYPVHLPWYGLLLALGICGVFFVPIGIVMAVTNQQSSLYLVCQLVCGTVFPGRPVANMVFVTYGYVCYPVRPPPPLLDAMANYRYRSPPPKV